MAHEKFYLPQTPILGRTERFDKYTGIEMIADGVVAQDDFYSSMVKIKPPDLHLSNPTTIIDWGHRFGSVLDSRISGSEKLPLQLYFEAVRLDREQYAQEFESRLDPDRPIQLIELGLEAAKFFREGDTGLYPPTIPNFYLVESYTPANELLKLANFWRPEQYKLIEHKRARRSLGKQVNETILTLKNNELEGESVDDQALFNFFQQAFYGPWGDKMPPVEFEKGATIQQKTEKLKRILPNDVDPYLGYVIINGRYYRCFRFGEIPSNKKKFVPGILLPLYNSGLPFRMSLFFNPEDKDKTLKEMEKDRSNKAFTVGTDEEEGKEGDAALRFSMGASMETTDQAVGLEENFFTFNGSIVIDASNLKELDQLSDHIQARIKHRGIPLIPTDHEHQFGVLHTLPLGKNRFTDDFIFPHMSTAQARKLFIMSAAESMRQGSIYIGKNLKDGSWAAIDQFNEENENYHIALAGPSGSGKDTLVKKLAHGFRQRGGYVVAIDTSANAEWVKLVPSVDGEVIDFEDGAVINLFEFPAADSYDSKSGDPMIERIDTITALVERLAKGLDADENPVVKKAILETYKAKGIIQGKRATYNNLNSPDLNNLYASLKASGNSFADRVASRIFDYVQTSDHKGTHSQMFTGHTNVNLKNKFSVIKITNPDNKDLTAIQVQLAMDLVTHAARAYKTPRMVVLEEIWRLEQETDTKSELKETASYIRDFMGMGRHLFFGLVTVNHTEGQYDDNKYIKSIADNCQMMLVYKHADTTWNRAPGNITEDEKKWFKKEGRRGRFLLIDKSGRRDPIECILTPLELRVFTTDPHHTALVLGKRLGGQTEFPYYQGERQSRRNLVEVINLVSDPEWDAFFNQEDPPQDSRWRTFESDKVAFGVSPSVNTAPPQKYY